MAGRNEVVDVAMHMHHATDRAVLVSDSGLREDAIWLPLSQVEVVKPARTDIATVTMPTWLAEKHGLI